MPPKAPAPIDLDLPDEAATAGLARVLARLVRRRDVLALSGELGTGKTVFARAFIDALGEAPVEVPSPTFTLVQTYDLAVGAVHHFDLFRLNGPEETLELDIDEAFAEGISLVEWPDRLGPYLPADRLEVGLAFGDSDGARRATLRGHGDWGWRLREAGLAERGELIDAFLETHGWGGARRAPLAGDASFRRYQRLRDGGRRAVLMDAPPPTEDVRPFSALARHLGGLGFSAPEVLAEDGAAGLLLLEDLGDDTYSRILAAGGDQRRLYRLAVEVLIDLHRRPGSEAIPAGLPPYDDPALLDEAFLLTDWYMPAMVGRPTPPETRDAYRDAWLSAFPAVHAQPPTLVLRDYHVDNLLWLEGRQGVRACGLLDFQDALAGPAAYDLVSLLEDARRDIDHGLVAEMLGLYTAAFPDFDRTVYAILGAQRHAKVIGIFTRLWVRDRKADYLVHIPRLWRLFRRALEHPSLAAVAGWLDRHIPAEARGIPRCPDPGP